MGILNWFQKEVNTPTDRHEAQTLHLLVRLVKKIDDRQQAQDAALADIQEQLKVVIDQSNRILKISEH